VRRQVRARLGLTEDKFTDQRQIALSVCFRRRSHACILHVVWNILFDTISLWKLTTAFLSESAYFEMYFQAAIFLLFPLTVTLCLVIINNMKCQMIRWSDLLRLKSFNLVIESLSWSSLSFMVSTHCMGGQNSVKKLPVLPNGVQPVLKAYTATSTVMGFWQHQVAVSSSCLQCWRRKNAGTDLGNINLSFFSLYLCLLVLTITH